jgi:hypothetical protein
MSAISRACGLNVIRRRRLLEEGRRGTHQKNSRSPSKVSQNTPTNASVTMGLPRAIKTLAHGKDVIAKGVVENDFTIVVAPF